MVQIKGSVRDSVWNPEFNMKHLKNAKGLMSRNIVTTTIKMSPNILSNIKKMF